MKDLLWEMMQELQEENKKVLYVEKCQYDIVLPTFTHHHLMKDTTKDEFTWYIFVAHPHVVTESQSKH